MIGVVLIRVCIICIIVFFCLLLRFFNVLIMGVFVCDYRCVMVSFVVFLIIVLSGLLIILFIIVVVVVVNSCLGILKVLDVNLICFLRIVRSWLK